MDVFPCISWVFVLTFVHVFRALDRSTSHGVSSQVFLFLLKWGIISYQITTDTLEDMINHLREILHLFLSRYLSGRILLEVTLAQVLSVDASNEHHPQFNIDRLPHNLRDAFVELKGFQTEHPINIEEKV
jgi:hypothetical protein